MQSQTKIKKKKEDLQNMQQLKMNSWDAEN